MDTNSKIISDGIIRAVAIITGIVITCYGLFQLKNIFIYITLAMVITLIGRPLIGFLKQKLHFGNMVAVLCTFFLIILVIIGIVSSFIPLLVTQGKNLSAINFEDLAKRLEQISFNIFDSLGIDLPSFEIANALKVVDFQNIPNAINGIISFVGDFGIGLFSVIFITFFFLKDGTPISNSLIGLINKKYVPKTRKSIEVIKNLLSRYFIGLLFQVTIIFVLLTITLVAVGVQNALIIAFLCALLNLIPYLGPLIGLVTISILTMSNFVNEDINSIVPNLIYVLIGFSVTQFIDNFLSQPLIFSNSVKSHPLEIFLVILVSGTLFGVLGMVAAVPVYTVIKVILKVFFEDNKYIKTLTKGM